MGLKDVPVFDKESRILGYLDVREDERDRPGYAFRRYATPDLSISDLEKGPLDTIALLECTFQWSSISSRRGANIWSCLVLIASDPDVLPDVRGFKWFAEMHGEKRELVTP